MIFAIWIGIALFAVTIIVGLVRALSAKDMGSRAIIGDLVYFSAVGILTLIAMAADMSIALDVIFLASMLGILSTIALSRIQTRGHR